MQNTARLAVLITTFALVAAAAGNATPAQGASFTVNATHDAVDAAHGDGVCADAGGSCTLRAAVEETNALPGGDTISVPAGEYVLSQRLGATGGLNITDDLTVAGAGPAATTIRTTHPDPPILSRIFNLSCSSGRAVQISDITISNGLFEGGGGIYNCGMTVTLRAVAMMSNGGGGSNGGAILNDGNLTIIDSTLSENWAQAGGAIANTGSLSVMSSTISNNSAVVETGGIASSGSAHIVNSTVSGNETGGLAPFMTGDGGTLSAVNTIVSNNSHFHRGTANCLGPITSLGHNLSSDDSCGLGGPGDLNSVQPQLTGLQDNGGPTLTHGLYPNSPAIDAGDNSGCPATDQRGVARPQGAACDIGAYEYVTPPTAPPTEPSTDLPPATDPTTDSPTTAPLTSSPKPSVSPSPSPTPLLNIGPTATNRRRPQPTYNAVLVDVPRNAPGVEEDARGGISPMALGLASAGALGLAGSVASAGAFWYRRRRHHRR